MNSAHGLTKKMQSHLNALSKLTLRILYFLKKNGDFKKYSGLFLKVKHLVKADKNYLLKKLSVLLALIKMTI